MITIKKILDKITMRKICQLNDMKGEQIKNLIILIFTLVINIHQSLHAK